MSLTVIAPHRTVWKDLHDRTMGINGTSGTFATPTCDLCGDKVKLYARANIDLGQTAWEGNDIQPLNISVDRRTPGAQGGDYSAENMAVTHVCCNLFKGALHRRAAIARLLALGRSTVTLGEDDFMPTPAAPEDLSSEDRAVIERWATRTRRRLARRHDRINARRGGAADALLTVEQLRAVLVQVYRPVKRFADVSGIVAPLWEAEVDRLDPRRGYVAGNVCLLLSACNWVRSNTHGDRVLAECFEHLRSRRQSLETRLARLGGEDGEDDDYDETRTFSWGKNGLHQSRSLLSC